MVTSAEPGWYDDGTGRQRWWDGTRWTELFADFGGKVVELRVDDQLPIDPADEFGGIVIEGRSIRFGALAQSIGGVVAMLATAEELTKRWSREKPARRLVGATGPITPRRFAHLDRRSLHVAIESADQVWLSPVAPHDENRARRFVSWVNTGAEHYRYR